MRDRPDLSIVIVNWNSAEFLRACLAAIQCTAPGVDVEVVVVDNGSFDGSADVVRAGCPEAKFIQSSRNLGFAKANNLGFASSTGRNVLFLNPDTQVRSESLRALVTFTDAHSDVGIVGPVLLNSDLSVQMESVRAFPSLLNQLLDSHLLKSWFPRLSIWGMRPLFEDRCDSAEVDVVSGASLMVKRSVFEDLGGFSDDYFMYSDDVDLCFRARQLGWKTCLVRDAVVIHHGGRSSMLSPVSEFASVMIRESRFKFLRLSRGRVYAHVYRAVTGCMAVVRLVLLGALFLMPGADRRSAVHDAFKKWKTVVRWSIGRERWVKTLA
jgi:GT2 family glycosyltransferase